MEAKLEKRLEDFLKSMDEYDDSYRSDSDMSDRRVDIYVRWISEINSNLKELAKKINEKELSCLLDSVEGVSSMKYFVFGTDYGSGYGIRPVLEITRNVLEKREVLGSEENRLAYVSALGEVYKKTREQGDPKYHYYNEDKKVNGYVRELNQKLDENPSKALEVIEEFIKENFKEGENEWKWSSKITLAFK